MAYSCRQDCTVCAQPAPKRELITDRSIWREPFDAIACLFGVAASDLDRHSFSDSEVSDLRKTDFPFFENSGFLLLGPANWSTYGASGLGL